MNFRFRKILKVALVLFIVSICLGAVNDTQGQKKNKFHPHRLIVQADSQKVVESKGKKYGFKIVKHFKALSKVTGRWFGILERKNSKNLSGVSAGETMDVVADSMNKEKGIYRSSPDHYGQATLIPNDPRYGELWGMTKIDAPEAWDITTGSSDVVIAVIDSGVDYNHPDLEDNMWENPFEIPGNGIDDDNNGYIDDVHGMNARNDSGDPMDDNNHGTHCSGTIGARGNNNTGVAGVNWNVKIMALKFLDNNGQNGLYSYAAQCLDYIVDMKQRGINVVATNNSWNGDGSDANLEDAFEAAGAAGILSVCSAGNGGRNIDSNPSYPPCYSTPYIISVANTTSTDGKASDSNYGSTNVDLGAPGTGILSTLRNNNYASWNGTSMAAPHVAGVVGLVAATFPGDTALEIRDRILGGVDPISSMSGITSTGGRLNAANALDGGVAQPSVTADFSYQIISMNQVSFTDDSTAQWCNVTGWDWDFGDGDTSTQENPTHVYSQAGDYTVTLTVTTDSPATDSATQTLYSGLRVGLSDVSIMDKVTDNANRRAMGFTMPEDGTIDSISMYHDNGGGSMFLAVYDGGTAPANRIATTGEVAVSGSTGWQNVPLQNFVNVQAGQKIWLAWVYENNPGIHYKDGTPGRASSDETWSGGMPATFGTSSFADYIYAIYASYTPAGASPPSADFSAGATTISVGQNVTFTDLSTNNPTSWSWTFDGGTPSTSTEQDPTVTYAAAGVYSVTLTATNAAGSDTETKTGYISVTAPQPPAADFTAGATGIYTGESVTFTDTSANSPTSWSWTFTGGTPSSSTAQNPTITYNTAGTYTVSLTATNAAGSDTETKTGYITVTEPPITPYLIVSGDNWKYFDQDTSPGTGWTGAGFDDSSWENGDAILGYSDNAVTEIDPGDAASTKYITAYFRKSFNYMDDGNVYDLDLEILRDDGAVVYINGTEVARSNMPTGTISHSTTASTAVAGDDEMTFFPFALTTNALVNGNNVIAVEIHQSGSTSSDLAFDLKLTVGGLVGVTEVTNIRFGSTGDPLNGLTVTWQNTNGTDKIKWGYTLSYEEGEFTASKRSDYSDYLYDYAFPALQADSVIYYSIYNDASGTWGPNRTFNTAPSTSATQFSFTVGGDSRTNMGDWNSISGVWDNSAFTLFVGDIVNSGSDTSDWEDWYDYGKNFIAGNLVYHTLGNHDTGSIYGNQFALPGNGLYYSFEYGNAVIICLNSEDPGDSAQNTWLENTLIANADKTWKFVFFHKPFYTTGSHEGEMDSYFNTWWQLFDDHGVNMIFGGHDHNYQRTLPINRNVSTSSAVAEYGGGAGQGRCQIVTGGAGAPFYAPSDRWWTAEKAQSLHFCLIEVDGGSLTLTVKDQNLNVIDMVAIDSGSSVTAPTADFSGTPTTVTTGGSVAFTDLSTDSPTSWSWTFNGGTPSTSTAQDPTITYNTAGTYTVELTATNAAGSDVETKTGYITVAEGLPTYTLTTSVNGAGTVNPSGGTYTEGTVVNIEAIPSAGYVFNGWSGALSGSTNPTTITMDADKHVTATFTFSTGGTYLPFPVTGSSDDAEEYESDSSMNLNSTDLELVDESGSNRQLVGMRFTGLTIPQGANITGAYIQFTCDNTNTGTTSLTIKAEDTDNPATFTTAAGNISNRTTTSASVSWSPPSWSTIGEAGTAQRTPDISSLIQEVLDRPGYSHGNPVTIIITGSGEREAESYDGTAAPILYIKAESSGPQLPMAGFTANTTSVGIGGSVNFTDTSTNTPTSWSWTFNGGTPSSSTTQNPTVTYNSAGTYTVSLTATNAAGSDTETKVNYITVTAPQPPTADFTASATSIDEGQGVTFTDTSTNDPTSWSWTFAGGTPSSSTAQNPTVTYNTAGTYTVSLTATNAVGSDTETKTGLITVSVSQGGDAIVGEQQVLAQITTVPNLRAQPFTMPESGVIKSVTMYHTGGSGEMILAVYDGETAPNALLSASWRETVSSTTGWQTLDLVSPVYAASGSTIWLAWTYENNPGIAYDTGTPGRAHSAQEWLGTVPESFGDSTRADFIYSIHATYTPVAGSLGETGRLASTTTAANRRAMPFTMSENGTIESISMYHVGSQNSGNDSMILAVYADSGGAPGNKLAQTPVTAVSLNTGWQTIDLESPVFVASGTTVWLTWVYESIPGIYFTDGTPGRVDAGVGWSGGMPSAFGSSTQANYIYSIHAIYDN